MLITTAPHVNHGQENTGRQESVWREGPEGSPNSVNQGPEIGLGNNS